MNKKALNVTILVIGIAVLLVSLFADPIGVGDYPGFGREQTAGSIAGALITAIGLYLTIKAR